MAYLRSIPVIGVLWLMQLTTVPILTTVDLTLAFCSASLTLNVLATLLIVGRLGYFRYRLAKALGPSHVVQYTGIMAIIVEAELLYTAYLAIYIAVFVLNNPVVIIFVQLPSLIQVFK